MSTWSVVWSQSGLTDNDVTVNYYEESSISASVSAIYQETEVTGEPPDEVTNILTEIPCYVTLTTSLSGVVLKKTPELLATITGTVQDVFDRTINYLIDNKDPKSRVYGSVDRISAMPQKKLFMYTYQKEQIPEKEVAVVATAYVKNEYQQLQAVGSTTYLVTVINVQNDASVIASLLAKHSAMEIE